MLTVNQALLGSCPAEVGGLEGEHANGLPRSLRDPVGPQHSDALLTGGHLRTSPHSSFWICGLSDSFEHVTEFRTFSSRAMTYLGQAYLGQFNLGQFNLGQAYLGQTYLGQANASQALCCGVLWCVVCVCVSVCVVCVWAVCV